jgi:hypothetical protein
MLCPSCQREIINVFSNIREVINADEGAPNNINAVMLKRTVVPAKSS